MVVTHGADQRREQRGQERAQGRQACGQRQVRPGHACENRHHRREGSRHQQNHSNAQVSARLTEAGHPHGQQRNGDKIDRQHQCQAASLQSFRHPGPGQSQTDGEQQPVQGRDRQPANGRSRVNKCRCIARPETALFWPHPSSLSCLDRALTRILHIRCRRQREEALPARLSGTSPPHVGAYKLSRFYARREISGLEHHTLRFAQPPAVFLLPSGMKRSQYQ